MKEEVTYSTEGMAELQVKGIDGNVVTHGQHSHSGQVACRVGDICTWRHAGHAKSWTYKLEAYRVKTVKI